LIALLQLLIIFAAAASLIKAELFNAFPGRTLHRNHLWNYGLGIFRDTLSSYKLSVDGLISTETSITRT
jgi:hypothetical protein